MNKSNTLRISIFLCVLTLAVYIPAFIHVRALSSEQYSEGKTVALPIYGSDSAGFVSLADNLISNGNFGHDATAVETFRTPGYPGLLALWRAVFGSYDYFPILQIALVAATALLLVCLGARIGGLSIGILGGVIFILDPNTVFHSQVILSEILHVFLLVLSITALFCKPKWSPIPAEASAGVLLGLATLVKPVSLYVPLLVIAYLSWVIYRSTKKWQRVIMTVLTFFLPFVAVMMPWVLRNYTATGVAGVSSVAAFNLFHYTVPEFLSVRDGIPPDEARSLLREKVGISAEQYSDLTHAGRLNSVAIQYIKEDPLQFAQFYTVKTIPFFVSSGLENLFAAYNDIRGETIVLTSTANMTNLLLQRDFGAIWREIRRYPLTTIEQALLALIVLFSAVAVIVRRRQSEVWLLTILIVYFAAVTGPVAYARFRIPAAPFLFILASTGFFASIGLLWRKRKELLAAPSRSSFQPTTSRQPLENSSERSSQSPYQKGSKKK